MEMDRTISSFSDHRCFPCEFPCVPRHFVFFLSGLLFLLAFFSLPQGLIAQESERDETVFISGIKIKGLKDIKVEKIKDAMITLFPSRKFWKDPPEFNEQFLEDDIKRIEQVLREHGYYGSTVTHTLDFRDGDRKVDIEITVDQGDPVIVKTLSVMVLGDEPDDYVSDVAKVILLEEGKPFSQINYQKSKVLITELFSEGGYPLADVKSEAIVSLRSREVNVELIIDPGREYYFGDVIFKGNSNIATRLLEREIEHEKGDLFSLSRTQKSRANIFETGLFNSVIVDTDYDEEKLEVQTTYSVTERKLGTIKFGVGYATEDNLRAQLSWNQRNFLDGGKTLQITSSYSSLTRGLMAELDKPHLIGKNSSLAFLLDVRRDDFPGYEGLSFDFNSTASKEFFDHLTVFSSINVVYADIESQVLRTPIESARDSVFITLLDLGVEYDLTDSLINPTRGMRLFLFMEKPLQIISSNRTDYLKFLAELRYYKNVSGMVLGKRLTIGNISTIGDTEMFDVPIFKRFFAGGSASMRGYSFQHLSPLNPDRDPLGGNSMVVCNAEIRFGLFSRLGGVIFFDYGNVYSDSFGFSAFDLKYAAGTGLRYNTIIGPIRADFGYLLNPDGEERNERFKIFISIGQAF
ncbi:MAG: BamA/TamA family outer membrane protein [Candidatus Dadabacteria bacterium]|nr:BamA/TamA family outer membrane protein [Candidatus Dadabacteria bacterium]